MTSQQENYIQSRLEAYQADLDDKSADWIEQKVGDALEEAEEKERARIADLNALGKLSLYGAAYESYMGKFIRDTEKELIEYFEAEAEEENEALVEEYRQELENEVFGGGAGK